MQPGSYLIPFDKGRYAWQNYLEMEIHWYFYFWEISGSCSCFHLSFCWRCCRMWRKTTPKSFHFPGLISWSVAAKIFFFFLFSSLFLKTWGSQSSSLFSCKWEQHWGGFFWKWISLSTLRDKVPRKDQNSIWERATINLLLQDQNFSVSINNKQPEK